MITALLYIPIGKAFLTNYIFLKSKFCQTIDIAACMSNYNPNQKTVEKIYTQAFFPIYETDNQFIFLQQQLRFLLAIQGLRYSILNRFTLTAILKAANFFGATRASKLG